MARKREPDDTPDVLLSSVDGRAWAAFCRLCVRSIGKGDVAVGDAYMRAYEHLRYSHGLQRVRIDRMTPGYVSMVQTALPLIVEHDLTLATDPLSR